MNKTSKLFMGVASLAMLAACSDDAPVMEGGDGAGVPSVEGSTVYMSVVLSAPGDFASRSTDFGDVTNDEDAIVPGDEHAVNDAQFFFFDEDGNYALKAKVVSPDFGDSSDKPNIEWESKSNILVLEDLKSNTYPRYMLTVLNMPDFTPSNTLDETAKDLVNKAYDLKEGAYSNFVMSTSSYQRTSNFSTNLTANSLYAVNELNTNDFKTTPTEATTTDNAVEIYVERLAAKVELNVNATASHFTDAIGTQHTIYKLAQTVAGEDNNNNGTVGGATVEGSDEVTGGYGTANTEIYLEVLGWTLNATAKQSNMSKQLKSTWFTSAPFTRWQNAGLFRSYWAYSQPYSLGDATAIENALDYVKYSEINADALNPKFGSEYPQYCMENTNDPAVVLDLTKGIDPTTGKYGVYNSRVTHIVLNTRLCDAEGNGISALNFRGTLYTEAALKAYALNALRNAGKLNFWKYTGTETFEDGKKNKNNYTRVDVSDIKFLGTPGTIGDATFDYASEDKLYAEIVTKVEVEGVETEVSSFDEVDSVDFVDALNSLVDARGLEWYNTRNIYFIPIEHNAPKTLTANANNVEGYYGVVRNHWYQVDITSFSKVGHGVYDPDNKSVIEIKPDDPEDTLYYLGARINVLSWRVIKQSVDL